MTVEAPKAGETAPLEEVIESRLSRALRGMTTRWRRRQGALSLEQVAASRLGRVVRGKYRLERVLGVGGMATVYAATHRNRRSFAIKMLHPELSVSPAVRTRFQREGYVTNSVNHPGAVAVLDDDVAEDGSAFLVMELLDGMGVDELWEMHGRALSVQAALALGDQLLDVLQAAHKNRIVHRDLKPANLFVTRDGALKVLDFGVARLREPSGGALTLTGATLGTPAFMAPEQAFGKTSELDAQADVWAVGATLFTLISGQFVHDGKSAQQLLANLGTRPARSLASAAPHVPACVVQVIDRALAFDKKERWPDAGALRKALQRAHLEAFGQALADGARDTVASLLSAHSQITLVPGRRRLRRSRLAGFVWLALALFTALAIGAWITLQYSGLHAPG